MTSHRATPHTMSTTYIWVLAGLGALLLASLLVLRAQAQQTECPISGIIAEDGTLGPMAESCDIYNVDGELRFSADVTLTISPPPSCASAPSVP